jgi:hypothetical protein
VEAEADFPECLIAPHDTDLVAIEVRDGHRFGGQLINTRFENQAGGVPGPVIG